MNVFVITLLILLLLGALVLFAQSSRPTELERIYGEPSKLVELVEKKVEPFILVDVRTPEEYRSGHIPGAINIPVDTIGSKPPSPQKDALIILYCRSGNRSSSAKKILEQLGYTRVVNFGAVSKWPKNVIAGPNPE
ncbi:MAG: rhodanese-like domain-containing protein [Spirochaetes bacterium]|nr:rhodanese-like domain-containing protein [Spirochaetota bacterium]